MKVIERKIAGRALTVIRIVERSASAVLELHPTHYNYYWRCLIGQSEFMRTIYRRQNRELNNLTLFDAAMGVEKLPLPQSSRNVSVKLHDKSFNRHWSLVRFDGPVQSWVWQYAPDPASDEVYAKIQNTAGSYPYREGLLAYIGCVSTDQHAENFRRANKFLADSAVDHDLLLPYTDHFERYLNQWRGEESGKRVR